MTNGVAALKYRLGVLSKDRLAVEYGFTSIPDLADRRLRSSLLYDGLYFPKGWEPFARANAADMTSERGDRLSDITAFFTVPTMGVDPDAVPDSLKKVRKAIADTLWNYRPQTFPGRIQETYLAKGQNIFRNSCATCHGTYEGALQPGALRLKEFPNRFSSLSEIGTDPMRAKTASDQALTAALGKSRYQEYMTIQTHDGYVAPILTGIWASAPYLHNGSVPTIWHLMHPKERPTSFMVGGHGLDFKKLGIRGVAGSGGSYVYIKDYTAWSDPEVYDTKKEGHGNGGHEVEFSNLTEIEKTALIEYLKLL